MPKKPKIDELAAYLRPKQSIFNPIKLDISKKLEFFSLIYFYSDHNCFRDEFSELSGKPMVNVYTEFLKSRVHEKYHTIIDSMPGFDYK